ncbi:MAG: DNA polymerase III subunit delta [Candidatus Magasanikbacteria bacterium]|nr:DNA polymerase III subunit delta [Candidatus Magasanikbacteria bacterium]
MFILLYGSNTFYSRQQLKKSIEDFKKQRDPSGMNTVVFDAEKAETNQVLESIVSSPFLAEKRMVVIEKAISKGSKDLLDSLWLMADGKKIPATAVVIFWEGILPEKKLHPLAEWLKKQKFSKEFKDFSPLELSNWITKELQNEKLEIENLALNNLIAHPLSTNLWSLYNELQKISAYVKANNGTKVTSKDVSLFLTDAPDDNTFHFIDALVSKNSKQAIKLLHDQWDSGAAEPQVFGALVWQFKTLLLVKDYQNLNPGAPSDLAAKNLAISPYVVKKSFGALRNFPFDSLKKIYGELLEIDKRVKIGEGDYKLLLDLLVTKVCK